MMRPFAWLLFFVGSSFSLGCGGVSGPTLHSIQGKVTFDNQPIKDGVINFDNVDKAQANFSGLIKEGAYQTSVAPGKYSVRITGMKIVPYPPGTVGASGEKEGPKQFLPAIYNERTTLSAEVTAGKKDYDFELKSK